MNSHIEHTPWTLAEFKAIGSGVPDEVLRPLLNICNVAIRNGLTRDAVVNTLTRLGKSHPDALPASVFITEIAAQIPDGIGEPPV